MSWFISGFVPQVLLGFPVVLSVSLILGVSILESKWEWGAVSLSICPVLWVKALKKFFLTKTAKYTVYISIWTYIHIYVTETKVL